VIFKGTELLELFLDTSPTLDGQLSDFRKLVSGHFTVGIDELDQA